MTPVNPNNPLGQSPLGSTPLGRVIESVEKYWLPSGKFRELRRVTETAQDANGVFRTHEFVEATPPLDCSCIPIHMADVAECSICGAVTCSSRHSMTCPECGRPVCTGCVKEIVVEGKDGSEKQVRKVCRNCAATLTTHPLLSLIRRIWE
jgi:hypothetical protein